MADPLYRSFSIFAGTKKVADFKDAKYKIIANVETVYADVAGGVAGYTQGSVEVSLSGSMVVPVAGTTYNFEEQLVAQNIINLGIGIVNGHVHQTAGRVISAEFDSDVKTGMLTGSYEIRALAPQIT